jgi:hypothetical protein
MGSSYNTKNTRKEEKYLYKVSNSSLVDGKNVGEKEDSIKKKVTNQIFQWILVISKVGGYFTRITLSQKKYIYIFILDNLLIVFNKIVLISGLSGTRIKSLMQCKVSNSSFVDKKIWLERETLLNVTNQILR